MCPNLNDLSVYAKRDDLLAGDIITFRDAGEIKEVDFSKTKDGSGVKLVFQIKIELIDGREKILTLNKISRDTLSMTYGNITENWVGKKAKVSYAKQLAFGKMTDVLVLEPVDREPGQEG